MPDDYDEQEAPAMLPTHKLCIITKDRKRKGTIGAAWQQADNSFFITLEAGVSIDWRDDITIRLFPISRRKAP